MHLGMLSQATQNRTKREGTEKPGVSYGKQQNSHRKLSIFV